MDRQKKAEELVSRGIADSGKGRHRKAVDSFRAALDLVPGNPVICFNLALEYLAMNDPEEALICLDTALEAEPKNPDYWCEKGIALYGAGDYPAAEKAYDQALSCGGDSARLWNSLGVLRFISSRYSEAAEFFRRAVELDSSCEDAWFNLADTLDELGDRKGAKAARLKYENLSSRGLS